MHPHNHPPPPPTHISSTLEWPIVFTRLPIAPNEINVGECRQAGVLQNLICQTSASFHIAVYKSSEPEEHMKSSIGLWSSSWPMGVTVEGLSLWRTEPPATANYTSTHGVARHSSQWRSLDSIPDSWSHPNRKFVWICQWAPLTCVSDEARAYPCIYLWLSTNGH